jgi:putative MFS transporter
MDDLANQGGGFMVEIYLSIFLLIGAFVGLWCVDKMTRRGFLISSFVTLTASLTLLALTPPSWPLVFVSLFALFTLVLSAVSNLVGVFPAESFPTEVRSSGIGLATAISRLGSVISTFLLPPIMAAFGVPVTMLILAAILLGGTVVSIAWAPETKGKSLNDAATSH